MTGKKLYLLPVWLGEEGGLELMPPANIAIAERVQNYFCESEKTARRMLRRFLGTLKELAEREAGTSLVA